MLVGILHFAIVLSQFNAKPWLNSSGWLELALIWFVSSVIKFGLGLIMGISRFAIVLSQFNAKPLLNDIG